MIKILLAITFLIACLVIALPIFMLAVPGVLLIIAIGLFSHWLNKIAANSSDGC